VAVINVNVQHATATPPPTVPPTPAVTPTPTATPTPTTTTATPTPAPLSGALDVWFKSPAAGATISGTRSGANCYVNASGSLSRVQFFMDNTALNTDSTASDGLQCALDTTQFANGSHQLKAVAYDVSG